MTVTTPAISARPISVPSSDVDFGALIENIDIENLSGE